MSYGLENAPSFFQSFTNDILCDMLNGFVIVYLDDILVYSKTYPEHIEHIRCVLRRLLDHDLYVKDKKFEFHQKESD